MIQKTDVITELKLLLEERMNVAWKAMEAAQESANEQGKSSMGDKYETSRSMGQLDRNMHARQYEQIRAERMLLERVVEKDSDGAAAFGSLLETTAGLFFIAVSLGPVKIKEEIVMAISSSSPVGASLLGKAAGGTFDFMKKQQKIIRVV